MTKDYVARRVGVFFIVIWLAASLNFLLPHVAETNPIRHRLVRQAAFGVAGSAISTQRGETRKSFEQVVETWERKFGLDQPLWKQYLRYMGDTARLDFGFSVHNFPAKVSSIILSAMPWTLAVVGLATIIAFILGTLLGALMVWNSSSLILRILGPPILALSAIPYYLLGLGLIFMLAFTWHIFPISGGYDFGKVPELNVAFIGQILHHAFLPALSIVLAQIGFWGLFMRGMMVTVQGEDYISFAEAKGLLPRRVFVKYAIRNAILPQVTNLALTLGLIITQAIIVEVVFSYPGLGSVLYDSIRSLDYFVIYGVVFVIILSVALATLLIDLLYPLVDPRIKYGAA